MNKLYEERGYGLVWAEFIKKGCPDKKEDYFLTNKDLLKILIRLLIKMEEKDVDIKS